jgi:hypothetical protein
MKSFRLPTLEKFAISKKEKEYIKGGKWICRCSCYIDKKDKPLIDDVKMSNVRTKGDTIDGYGDITTTVIVSDEN